MLISKFALDCQPYNTTKADVTWESCSLRKWVNDTFLNDAFNEDERAIIQNTSVSAYKNPIYNVNPGNDTTDRVFLLSFAEANEYITSFDHRNCEPTKYAVASGAKVDYQNGNCTWWERGPGKDQSVAAVWVSNGSPNYMGVLVDAHSVCVRPAMWISLDSEKTQATPDNTEQASENEQNLSEETLTITISKAPTKMTIGKGQTIAGTISSGSEIVSATVQILDADGNDAVTKVTINPNTKTIDIKESDLNKLLKFGEITKPGTYTIKITATDASGKTAEYTSEIVAKEAQ